MTVASMDISREQRTEILASADPDSIQRLSEIALSYAFVSESLVVTKKPETGLVMMQVREPVCKERFYLGEIAATRAEVLVNNEKGWAIRLGTDTFNNSMIGNRPHRLDQDVRSLRLRLLPNHTFGKVALFSRAPSEPISPRACTAKQ
jgi:hypothetical protein